MLFNYTCIVDSTWKHMIIEALKFEACTEAKLAWGCLLGVGFLLRQRFFTSLFPSFVIRASSHPICSAKVWAPRALQQWQGHSQCRGTAQGTNLETVSAKAEGELLKLDICQIKKKRRLPAHIRDIRDAQSKLCKFKTSSLRRGWNLGCFTDSWCVWFQNTKGVREGHSSLQLEPQSTALDILIKICPELHMPPHRVQKKYHIFLHSFPAQNSFSVSTGPIAFGSVLQLKNQFWPNLPGRISLLIRYFFFFCLLLLKISIEISNWKSVVVVAATELLVFYFPEGKCFLMSKHCRIVLSAVLHKTSVRISINC